MKIKYYPVDNTVTPDSNDCRMQVAGYETVSEKEIFEYMTRPGSGVTLAEAKCNYEEFIGAHEYFLGQGYGINTEFINVRPTIQGTLRDRSDTFDHSRHKVRFKVTLGKRYNNTSGEVKVEKVEATNNLPMPLTVEDITTGEVNGKLTSGGTAVLTGIRLNFREDDPEQGVFITVANSDELRAERIISHSGTQIVFVIPVIPEGNECALDVRMLPHNGRKYRVGILPDKLYV